MCIPETMQAIRFYAPKDVRLETIATPQPQAGEVLLKVKAALTCGTDLKAYRRGHPVLLGPSPARFGHEFSGQIAALGDGVEGWQVGQAVAAVNSAPCGHCFFCEAGQPQLCEHLQLLNGGYGEYICIPAPIVKVNMHPLSETLSFEKAAFCEPLAVAMRGVLDIGLQAGQHIAILGLGPIGQLMVKVATESGLHVTAIARNDAKLAMAQTFGGASQCINIAAGFDPVAIAQTHSPQGRGFDAVIEAVGLPETWEKSVSLVRRGGKVHWFAGCEGGSEVRLETRRIHYDEITLYSLFHHTPAFVKQSLEWLASGRLDPTPLISERLPLAELEVAFQHMAAGQTFKASILP